MAIRNIREMGDDVLGKVCKEVTQMNYRTQILIQCTKQVALVLQHLR